ncbi:MAG: fibro-slime domain-containing protein [Planctomycetota bacterium]|jgi:fibro-slime domain-containing protein
MNKQPSLKPDLKVTPNSNLKLGVASGLVGFAGMMLALSLTAEGAPDGGASSEDEPPDVLNLTGVVRDFRERNHGQGHPDFEVTPDLGYGHYHRNVEPFLGADHKPVFSGQGRKVTEQWRDDDGRPICYLLYDPDLGDDAGSAPQSSRGGIASAESFDKWFNDHPGVNMSAPLTVDLARQADGTYVFDDSDDPQYSSLGGFFPIEDRLFGNPGGSPDRNFHFTFELHTDFVYEATGMQHFRFVGDDDVWVYIDGNLVIDLGGVHAAVEQYVDLNRLGLVDGETYTLDFFFAERHRTQSNFRIQTNIELRSIKIPSITDAFD